VEYAFSWYAIFLDNTIHPEPLPEIFGMNERLIGFKTGYLLSGISKKLRLGVNQPAKHLIFG
jgi:hypothetical protein